MADDATKAEHKGQIAHRGTYDGFMGVMKWGIGFISLVLILMAIFLA